MGIFNKDRTGRNRIFGFKDRTGNNEVFGYKGRTGDNVAEGTTQGNLRVTDPIKGEALAKTIISGGTALGSLGFINKTAREQEGRNMRMLTPIQTTVAPVQDLPAEVLAQRENNISRLRSTYRGSDPSMKLISDLTAGAQRTGLSEQLASERGTNLINERRRVASEEAANQARAGDIQHKNIQRQQELDDYKLGARVNRLDHLNKLFSQVGATALDNIETAEQMGIKADQVDRENAVQSIDTEIQHLNNKKAELIAAGYDPMNLDNINVQIQDAINRRNAIQRQSSPRFFKEASTNKYSGYFKNGGKLIPR